MDGRELYPGDEQRRRIMDFIMAAGETLLENGAEVFRVEQTMEIMARSFHLREFHVYVLTNGIFASAGTAEIAEVRNVPVRRHAGRGRVPSGRGPAHPLSQGPDPASGRNERRSLLRPHLRRHSALGAGGGCGRLPRQRLSAALREKGVIQRLPQDLGGSAHYIGLHSGVPSAGH